METNSASLKPAPVTWVLVADGGEARVYRYDLIAALMPLLHQKKHRHELTPVPHMNLKADPLQLYNVDHDQRGSMKGSTSSARNTCEERLDIRDEVKQNLVKEIAAKLETACDARQFDNIVIAAPPKTLGLLRKSLAPEILDRVIAEFHKDFTDDRRHALITHLEETLKVSDVA